MIKLFLTKEILLQMKWMYKIALKLYWQFISVNWSVHLIHVPHFRISVENEGNGGKKKTFLRIWKKKLFNMLTRHV